MSYDFRKWSIESAHTGRRRSRWLRWFLLFGLLMTLPIPLILTFAPGHAHETIPSPAIVFPLIIGMAFSPFARAPWLTAWGRAIFDEFESAAMQRATVAAYATLLGAVTAGLFYLWLASMTGWPAPATPAAWGAWGMALAIGGLSLPAVFAEWMVPLPPSPGADEDDGELL